MNNEDDLEPGLRQYFRAKAAELKAQAEQAIAHHGGLQGSHRENINKNYLKIILPSQFSIGNGMIYDSYGNRSKEADIVLWDADNYPSLPMSGHSVFFAESVRVVLEVKSTWSSENFADIKEKCRKITQLRPEAEPSQADHISYMKEVIKSMMTGNPVPMYTLEQPKTGTAAIIFNGGEKFKAQEISQEEIEEIDNAWPDILLLLSAGRVMIKRPRDRNRSPKNIRHYTGKYPS